MLNPITKRKGQGSLFSILLLTTDRFLNQIVNTYNELGLVTVIIMCLSLNGWTETAMRLIAAWYQAQTIQFVLRIGAV